MFLPLDRVKVLESSSKGKYHPRKNSEGFISSHSLAPKHIKLSASVAKVTTNLLAVGFNVVWYKFGNELRTRAEQRRFAIILPIPTKLYPADKFMDELPKIVKNPDITNRIHRAVATRDFGFLLPKHNTGIMVGDIHKSFLAAVRSSSDISRFLYHTQAKETKGAANLRPYIAVGKKQWDKTERISQLSLKSTQESEVINHTQALLAPLRNGMLRTPYKGNNDLGTILGWAVAGALIDQKIIKRRKLLVASSLMSENNRRHCYSLLDFLSNLQYQI